MRLQAKIFTDLSWSKTTKSLISSEKASEMAMQIRPLWLPHPVVNSTPILFGTSPKD